MGKKRERSQPKARLSPTKTFENLTDDFMAQLDIPKLPDRIPDRLATALRNRIQGFLFCLRESRSDRFVEALEIRIMRDAHRAVLTAYELKLADSEVHYAAFRQLADELGYERTDVGLRKRRT